MGDENDRPKLEKLEKHLNLWKSRSLSLVGKSLIINVLGISKLLYLSAVLCVPKWVISRINNLVWPFLWGSRIETVSRMTCHQSLGKGGLGIFNFQTKSDSLKLASLISILDDRESKSFFLTKYLFGSRLAPCRPEWRSLRDNSTPSTQNLTPYYEKCFSILASLRGIVSRQEWRDFVFSSKKCYLALLRENSASPILHRFWSAFLPIDFDLDRFWVSVRDDFSENHKNDILWLIVLRAVKVRDSLKNWGYIDSDKCASCSRKETIDHCFLNCVRLKRVWSFFSPVLNSLAVGVHQVLLPLTPLGEHGPTALCRQVFVHLWPARLARYMAFPVFLRHRPPRHRPELEGGAWRAVYGTAPGILRTVSSPCLFLWSDHRISRSPLLLLSVSAKCSVVVAIVVVQFLLHVSGSLGASRLFQL